MSAASATMRIIRAAECRRMKWKNGGGETVEIVTHPEGAGLDEFLWRLSAARVAQDGPFSLFPGIDRTLAVLSGDGIALDVGGTTTRLGPADAPLSFPGDEPTGARLLGGAVEDLNIMTRRGIARHRMRRLPVEGPTRFAVSAEVVLAFCGEGSVVVEGETLQARDTAILTGRPQGLALAGPGRLYLVEIEITA